MPPMETLEVLKKDKRFRCSNNEGCTMTPEQMEASYVKREYLALKYFLKSKDEKSIPEMGLMSDFKLVTYKNKEGDTVLHKTCRGRSDSKYVNPLYDLMMTALLLAKGADPNLKNKAGLSAADKAMASYKAALARPKETDPKRLQLQLFIIYIKEVTLLLVQYYAYRRATVPIPESDLGNYKDYYVYLSEREIPLYDVYKNLQYLALCPKRLYREWDLEINSVLEKLDSYFKSFHPSNPLISLDPLVSLHQTSSISLRHKTLFKMHYSAMALCELNRLPPNLSHVISEYLSTDSFSLKIFNMAFTQFHIPKSITHYYAHCIQAVNSQSDATSNTPQNKKLGQQLLDKLAMAGLTSQLKQFKV